MKKTILYLLLTLLSVAANAQIPVRLEVLNQFAIGDKFYFDVYMRTTDGSSFYLNQTSIALNFDASAFNNPTIAYDGSLARLKTVDGRTVNPAIQSVILKEGANKDVISIEYLAPYVDGASQVRNSIALIDSRVNVHCLGRFIISNYNQTVADIGMRVVTIAPTRSHLATKVNTYTATGEVGVPGNIDGAADSTFVFVRLGAFTALPAGRSAELEWTTQNEIRMNSFEIERSIYVDRNFVKIGEVPSKGFPNTLSVYRNIDRDVYNPQDPIPIYYYRIKYLAENGTSAYSPVRAVNFNEFNEIDLVTWPNPTSDAVNLQLRNVVDETIIVRLLSRNGAELGQKRFSPNDIIRFEVSNVAPGVYFLEVITSKGKRTEKVVVWR
ncbi:MAG: T9SS type A sorting domain-containing protein [Sphingobacteriaceae bacterium]|nr:T9SS type A sorting domain-containing protein [Sphingobacteriaceae bacterium]